MTTGALIEAARGLVRTPDGLWTSHTRRVVSYPEGDHDRLFAVEDHSFWFAHRNRCLAAWIPQHPPPGALLDVGAGNGFVASALIEAGLPTVALEPSAAAARHARSRGLDPVICATLEDAAFEPGSVPAAGLFDVLEHIEDRPSFLEHLRSRLQVGGRVYLTVPALRWLWSGEDVRAGHHLRYTRRTLTAELAESGLSVEVVRPFFAHLVVPVLLMRVIAERLALRRASAQALARDLAPGSPLATAMANGVGAAERSLVAMGVPIPLGTSLYAVATRR